MSTTTTTSPHNPADDFVLTQVHTINGRISPKSVTATGKAFPGQSRPLCPYPKHAQYKGSGDMEKAENFECR